MNQVFRSGSDLVGGAGRRCRGSSVVKDGERLGSSSKTLESGVIIREIVGDRLWARQEVVGCAGK